MGLDAAAIYCSATAERVYALASSIREPTFMSDIFSHIQ